MTEINVDGDAAIRVAVDRIRHNYRYTQGPRCKSTGEILKEILNDKSLMKLFSKYVVKQLKDSKYGKCDEISSRFREEGNAEFKNKEWRTALDYYNESLMFTPLSSGTSLAITYANRSAALFELGSYEYALDDIDRAEYFGYPNVMKYKLHHRRASCHLKLGNRNEALQSVSEGLNNVDSCVQDVAYKIQVRNWFMKLKIQIEDVVEGNEPPVVDEIEDAENKMKELKLGHVIKKTEHGMLHKEGGVTILEGMGKEETVSEDVINGNAPCKEHAACGDCFHAKNDSKPASYVHAYGKSKTAPSLSTAVSIGHDPTVGYYSYANRQLNIGDIIMIERQYVGTLYLSHLNTNYCSFCYQRAQVMLIPCYHCIEVRYCSDQCRTQAWKEHHYVECGHARFLYNTSVSSLLALRALLKAGKNNLVQHPSLDQEKFTHDGPDLEKCDCYDPESYNSIYNLPFVEQSSLKTEAVLGSVIMLHILEQMQTRISQVENGSIKVEDVIPNSPITRQTSFKAEEKRFFATLLTRHWLQYQTGVKMQISSPSCAINKDEKLPVVKDEHIAVGLFPTFSLFKHSCDPNVDIAGFDGTVLICRAARPVDAGEKLCIAIGVNWYQAEYRVRQENVENLNIKCTCKACERDASMIQNPQEKSRVLVALEERLIRAEEFKEEGKFLEAIQISAEAVSWGREFWMKSSHGPCLFWQMHVNIEVGVKEIVMRECESECESDCVHNIISFGEVAELIRLVKEGVHSLHELELAKLTSVEISIAYQRIMAYVRIVTKLSEVQGAKGKGEGLKSVEGHTLVVDLMLVLKQIKEMFLRYSCSTPLEKSSVECMESAENWLEELSNLKLNLPAILEA